jgi:hypothetical protein
VTHEEVRAEVKRRLSQAVVLLNTLDNLAWQIWPDVEDPLPKDLVEVLTMAVIASGTIAKALKRLED